jgi:hypothetical protein
MSTIASSVQSNAGSLALALPRMTADQLASVYAEGDTVPLPHGDARGIAMLFPNSGLSPVLARAARVVWQGKSVDAAAGTLVNRVFGLRLIPAKVYEGESWFDNGRAIIIDYQDTSRSFFYMRDEVRRIADGLFLGRSYYRKSPQGRYVLSFAMDFTRRA